MPDVRARLAAGDTMYGTFLGLGSALAAEACAVAGFGWLLVDLEHGGSDEQALLHQQIAADAHGLPMFARVESADRIRAGRVLDLGVAGVMFPRLEDPSEVRQAIRHLRYPPDGDRGVAVGNRVYGFGLNPDALDDANEKVIGLVQIESGRALDAVSEIAAIPGVDVLFVGPRDLSHDLGIPGQTQAPEFREALDTVLAATRKAGRAAGILANDAQQARHYADLGFRFIGIGSDSVLLARAAREAVLAVRFIRT
jgi:2-dehydro-3-deoxyglucarate aldolase/4-hydroxy-2-oxoheptanedioate aldolase